MASNERSNRRDPQDIAALLPSTPATQLVGDDGDLIAGAELPASLAPSDLVEMYRLMVVSRRLDLEAIRLQRQGQLGLHISSKGQEAAQVGSAYALEDGDWVFPQGRELPAAVTRGLDVSDLLHVWRGTALSHHDPYRHSFAFVTIPIATQCLHAAGFALGAKLDHKALVVLCYVGDGGTSEGDFHEALNMAGVWQVPCVFFVQNNKYALSVPVRSQTRAPSIAHKAVGYGMPGYRIDGNDVVACFAVTKHALQHARAGNGPVLIEALTYRQEAHSTSDDPSRYRPDEEVQSGERHDPIRRFGALLETQDLVDADRMDAIAKEADDHASELRSRLVDATRPPPTEIFDFVYDDMPPTLAKQRTWLLDELGEPGS